MSGIVDLQDARLKAFLSLVAWSEGTSTNRLTKCDGYDVIVSGPEGPEVFTDFSHHPFEDRPAKVVNAEKGLRSTASGRYQILCRYWETYAQMLGLVNFEPASQDAVAIQQMREVGALPLIYQGDIAGAVSKCSGLWASLPGNNYGQGAHPIAMLMEHWETIAPVETA